MPPHEKQYVWIVEGQPTVGPLAQYARDWETAHSHDLAISAFVWTARSVHGLQMHKVQVSCHYDDGSDYITHSLTVQTDTVRAQIDGRA